MTDETRETPGQGASPPAKLKTKHLMPPDWDEELDGEWDDEYASEQAIAEGNDLELIVEYLNKHLDPERTEMVRRRLEEDEAFRELAAPMLLVWSIPTHVERHPRPAGELERNWDRFTKAAGFAHQRRKARRRRLWLLAITLATLGAFAFIFRAPIRSTYTTLFEFDAVPHQSGWLHLGDSIWVALAPDAALRAARLPIEGARHFILRGDARFRVAALDSATTEPRPVGIVIRTRAGLVTTREAEFRVTANRDSTLVDVKHPTRRRFEFFFPIPNAVHIRSDATSPRLQLREASVGLLVRGQAPIRLIADTDTLDATDTKAKTPNDPQEP